jgi:hypothetical protein
LQIGRQVGQVEVGSEIELADDILHDEREDQEPQEMSSTTVLHHLLQLLSVGHNQDHNCPPQLRHVSESSHESMTTEAKECNQY